MAKILVTGGAGYIGSHTCIELLEAGFQIVVLDNLCNSSVESIRRVSEITGKDNIPFYQGDIRDALFLDKVFTENKIEAVIHFAACSLVGDSVEKPLLYFNNN